VGKTTGAAAFVVLAVLVGCGSSKSPSVKEVFVRGIEQIRGSHSSKRLHAQLVRTISSLRRKHSKPGRRLAIQGFGWALKGVDAQVDLIENDSGNLEAAVRDAATADRYRRRGEKLLRATGRMLGVSVGTLGGY
jgi:hypothetical protein